MSVFISQFRSHLRKLDVSSTAAVVAGITSIVISAIIAIVTLYKLLLWTNVHFLTGLLISVVVFYIVSEIYSFVLLFLLSFIEQHEDVI
jgi:hypothetical protein